MPKRSSRPSRDANRAAFDAVEKLTAQNDVNGSQGAERAPDEAIPEKNPHAQALGRLGGLKGGKARAKKLTKKRRAEIARKAARARWGKDKR